MVKPTLEFLRNEAGEAEGLGDAGIETFRDAPYASCAREAGQNARDAADTLPVRMSFDLVDVPTAELPAFDRLRDALEACSRESRQDKEQEFFRNALTMADRERIPVLRIADSNTKGLSGPPEKPGTPFHALLKGSGVTAKDAAESLGSFGIGKNASFAVSDLQTVFYSSAYRDGGAIAFAAQGKVKLISHTDFEGQLRRATGYWGDPDGFGPVKDQRVVPTWMRRQEPGTSVFSVGFRESPTWVDQITCSLAANFFCAIHRGEMEFEVDSGRRRLNPNTLEPLFSDPDIEKAAENMGQHADLGFAGELYRCLVSDASESRQIEIEGLGTINARVLAQEGLPRRVGFVRNGMLITDNLRNFGQPLQRFPGSRDFIALVEPASPEAVRLMKQLENPAHNAFSSERISDPQRRKAAGRAMRKLGQMLRDIIKDTTGVQETDSVVLDELGRFFASQAAGDAPSASEGEPDPETYEYEVPRRKERRTGSIPRADGEQGGAGGKPGGTGGDRPGPGSGEGGSSGGSGSRGGPEGIDLRDIRNRIENDSAGLPTSRVLHFTADLTGRIAITLFATGVNAPERLKVVEASPGAARGGRVELEAREGERVSVSIRFAEPYAGPIEVTALSLEEETADQ